jgi:hypothetical protein
MEYSLTLEDINKLSDLGFDMRGVPPGELAEMEEMVALGIDTRLPEEQPEIDTNSILPPINEEIDVPARVDTPQPAGTGAMNSQMQQLLDLIKSQQAAAAKPASQELSKTQKRMLAFAGIADAGRALQGKEGTAVASLLGNFTDLADQRRKAEAAQAQRQMINTMMGGTDFGNLKTSEDYRLAAQQMAMMAASMGQAGAPYFNIVTQLTTEANRLRELETGERSTVTQSVERIETIEDLMKTVEQNPSVTGFWGMVTGLAPFTDAGQARIDVDTIRSNMALDALRRLKASGATLGSVSEKELTLLEADIQRLDLNQKREKVLADLTKIRNRYQNLIRRAFENTNDRDALVKALGGEERVASFDWLQEPDDYYINFNDVKVGEIIRDVDPDTGEVKYYEYLGGPKTGQEALDSWRELR